MEFELLVKNGTVVFPDRPEAQLDVAISNGRIAAVLATGSNASAKDVIDASGKHVFPGLIDCHLHYGFGEKITEYSTETAYAAQGGFSTVLGYLLNNGSYDEVFDRELGYAKERSYVDFGFHLSMANEVQLQQMPHYINDFGIGSFKYYMNFKGEEGRYMGLDGTDDGYLYELLETAAKFKDIVVVCHAENIEIVNRIRRKFQQEGRDTLRDWALSKPAITEAENLMRATYFGEKLGATVYIPHVSSRLSVEEARVCRKRNQNFFLETCPHYLTHTMDMDIGSMGKANPPFKTRDDLDALWEALADGTIEVVASDHVPRKRATKEKPLWQASQGFPGSATILPVLLSEGYHKGRLSLDRICAALTAAPARIFHMDHRKGHIRPGHDGDLTIVDLNRERTVVPSELGSYSDYSLYEGWKFRGWPVRTIVRGKTVMNDGKLVGKAGWGEYLRRSPQQ